MSRAHSNLLKKVQRGDKITARDMNLIQALLKRTITGPLVSQTATGWHIRRDTKEESAKVLRLSIQDIQPDYLVCWGSNGVAWAGPDILVAKPYLAVQTFWDGGTVSRDGVTFIFRTQPYADGQELDASKIGETPEHWAITPFWLIGDEIDVVAVPAGTRVFDLPAGNTARRELFLRDANTDGRAWAVVPAGGGGGVMPGSRGPSSPPKHTHLGGIL